MAAVQYTAKRSIISGHVLDSVYDLDLKFMLATRQSKPIKNTVISLGGQSETVEQRTDVMYRITITDIGSSELAALREFLDSTDYGEAFLLDIEGSVAVPVNPQTVESMGGYAESRMGFSDYYQVAMTVRVV